MNIQETKSYAVTYIVSAEFGEESKEMEIKHRVEGYKSLYSAKKDVESQILVMMRKNGINKASLSIDLTFEDSQGEYVDSDTVCAEFQNGKITNRSIEFA